MATTDQRGTTRAIHARDARRLMAGAGRGAVASAAMGGVMLVAAASGVSPMPKPVPAALVSHALGELPRPGTVMLAVATHVLYGAVAGAVFAGVVHRVTVRAALAHGVALWVVMGVAWLPYLGWGPFGTGVSPKIAVATLVLHLVYGVTLGWLLGWSSTHCDRGATAKGSDR